MGVHSSLGASSAHRWMRCPASVKASAEVLGKEPGLDADSEFSHEGTCAHYLAEIALKSGRLVSSYVGEVIELPDHDKSEQFDNEFEVTKEMANYVAVYVDFCRDLPGDVEEIEARLDYSDWVEGGFGTGDYLKFDEDSNTLYVVDLKYGKGIRVDAFENKQLLLYGLGGYSLLSLFHSIGRVKMVVVQPRLDHIDEYEVITRDLLKFGEEARKAAEATKEDDPVFNPGESQCQWCYVAKSFDGCQAQYDFVKEEALSGLGVLDDETLTQDDVDLFIAEDRPEYHRVVKILKNKSLIESLIKQAKEIAYAKAMAGEPLVGTKLVRGRKSKSYAFEDEEALRRLKQLRGTKASDVQVVKPITPAAAFKLLGKDHNFCKKYITINDGKPTIVSDDDDRDAIDIKADSLEGL